MRELKMRNFTLFAAVVLSFVISGCATKPTTSSKQHFEVQYIRQASRGTNWGYRHAERTSPYVDDQMVIQGSAIDGISAFGRSRGELKWFLPVADGVESGTAAFEDNLLFGGSDGHFYSIKKSNGKVNWTFPTRAENLAAPLIDSGVVYFLSGNNILYALDAKSGKKLWTYNRGEVNTLSVRGGSRPAIFNGTLYCGFADGFLAAINSKDGSLIWERKLTNTTKFTDIDASPFVDETSILISSFDGSLYSLSRTDGQILWRLEDGGATPVTVQGPVVYYGSNNQAVYAIDRGSGRAIWKYNMSEGVPTQPVVDSGVLYFGNSENDLIALDQKSGQKIASYRPGAGVFSAPVIDTKTRELFFLTNGSNLHVVKLEKAF